MMLVQLRTNKKGRRLYLVGHRVHHGVTGCVLTTLGICLALHDRKDWRRWMKDLME